ncbi:MAG: kynureninase [Pseudomonadota bacterium]
MRRHLFELPEGVIYLDGNSLGPLPKVVPGRVEAMLRDQWGAQLIGGWNHAGWMAQPTALGDRVGALIGAKPGSLVLGDTLSIKVYQALAAALALQPDRRVVLSDTGNFPTDLYMADGLLRTIDKGHRLKLVEPQAIAEALDETVAVLLLTHVDYRTGRMHDMAALTEKAHAHGIPVIWDLAHSAGAVPVDFAASGAEFAIGCTYKYLNAGPGAPAFIAVRPDIADTIEPALAGWLGHAAPFAFDRDYRPGPGIERLRVGTPPVIQMAALDAAMDVWDGVAMEDIRARSLALSELFIVEVERRCPDVRLVSPRDPDHRGSQVSFAFEQGYAVIQALIARGVIGDFRAPNIMRFGFTPLYLEQSDVFAAAEHLETVMAQRLWDDVRFKTRAAVT